MTIDEDQNTPSTPRSDLNEAPGRRYRSTFDTSPLRDYLLVNDGDTEAERERKYKLAVAAFERETSVLLNLNGNVSADIGPYRRERLKTFILKLLLFIGVPPDGNYIPISARLIEILTYHPELSASDAIEEFAKCHNATADSISRIVDAGFNIFDNDFCERVTHLTHSHPMTSKDILCDLGVYLRRLYTGKLSCTK